jgi:benzodiazapine receptor
MRTSQKRLPNISYMTRFILFLACNFGGLAIGGLFTGSGVSSEWYQSIQKAPWTPPGPVFGLAWTTIMICYSLYLSYAWNRVEKTRFWAIFGSQWLLNVSWNPVFFHFQMPFIALIIITLLWISITWMMWKYPVKRRLQKLLLLPYAIWLLIATSLNTYIVWFN